MYALIFAPGTLIHEASHFLMALFILVPVGQLEIIPEIQDDKITFEVYLEESHHPKLRPNLQVPLLVVSGMKEDVLRLEAGPALEKGNNVEVYVVEGDRALLRKVSLGMKGPEYVEIISGIDSGNFDIIILDEIITGVSYKLIEESRLKELISHWRNSGQKCELVLSGRGADEWLIDQADLVTEMRKIKHYFDRGVEARKGIEF